MNVIELIVLNKFFSPLISEDNLTILKELERDKTIKIIKPAEGRGTVIKNIHEYKQKIIAILSGVTKFCIETVR